jgi:hypothetical protein
MASSISRLSPRRILNGLRWRGRRGVRYVRWLAGRPAAGWHLVAEAREVARHHHVSTLRLLREQAVLYFANDITPHSYYAYRLFDPAIPWEEKRRYLPTLLPTWLRIASLLTPDKYRGIYDNKVVFNRFFGSLGFPVAMPYGVYDPVWGSTTDGQPLRTADDLRRWVRTSGVQEFVFKPVEGMRGSSVLVFASRAADDPEVFLTLSGERYDAARLAEVAAKAAADLRAQNPGANTRSFVLEQRIHQHPRLVSLLGQTLCCVRAVTFVGLDGEPRLLSAVFKAQPNPTGVDHMFRGAIACWVDPATGILGRGRTYASVEYTDVLPSGARLAGFELPLWPQVRELALRAAKVFPWARSMGWDISMTESGPFLVEGNERWDPALAQIPAPQGLFAGEFRKLCEALRRGEQ